MENNFKPEKDIVSEILEEIEQEKKLSEASVESEEKTEHEYAEVSEEETMPQEITLSDIDEKISKSHEVLILLSEQIIAKNKVINQLSEELKSYKSDMDQKLLSSIFRELISMRDSIIRVGKVYEEKEGDEKYIPLDTFTSYAFDLENIFENNGYEIYESKQGAPFTPGRQSAIKKIATDNESLHGTIAESICNGYALGNRIVSAEKVAVYYYVPAEEKTSGNEENSDE